MYEKKLREEILKKYWSGIPTSDLAKEYDISYKTIYTWNYNINHCQMVGKKGRPKKGELTREDYIIPNIATPHAISKGILMCFILYNLNNKMILPL